MWNYITRKLLRYRLAILIILLLSTCYMGYEASKVKMSYEMARMLPGNDKHFTTYQTFKSVFGEDGNVIFIGFQDSSLFELSRFNSLRNLCDSIKKIDGVANVLSVVNIYTLEKNDSLHKFDFKPIIKQNPQSQQELDSLKRKIYAIRFYDKLLFNKENACFMTGITLSKDKLNDKSRIGVVNQIKELVEKYAKQQNIEMHCSGLPYIRTVMTKMIQDELFLFIAISLAISFLIMVWFYKSFPVVFTSMIVVIISVIWALGSVSLFGFKISILIGVFPSLVIIIAIENCIYKVNKYHLEYKKHGNKIKAISRVVSGIGFATFITNATTAMGFATFIFTSNEMLKEFGIVSSINIMIEFVLSLVIMVIVFSYLPAPKEKHLTHIDRKTINFLLNGIKHLITHYRKAIYILSAIILLLCAYGVTQMSISGKLLDDISPDNSIYKDMKFFERNAGGVMPFEISIDTKEKNGIFKDGAATIYKIKRLQNEIKNDSTISPYFSRPISIVEAISFANQMYRNGNPKYYMVPPPLELNQLGKYVKSSGSNKNAFHGFIDSNMQRTRVSIQMADVGTKQMNHILSVVKPKIDSIFPASQYDVAITGNSIVFTKGTEFLIGNLWESIIIGIVFISILMAIIFTSLRMIGIAMIVNLIPLFVTAAIMGFFNIPIKPSTIIVFSVALGISVDNAILFLSRYRNELKKKKLSIKESVLNALDEVGISMIYTSIILVIGFAIYMMSDFGGTKALGFLISVALFVALFFNIIVLPALLLSLDKYITTKAFKEPLIAIEEEDDNNE